MIDYRSHSRTYLMNKGMGKAASDALYDQVRSAMEHFVDSWLGDHPVQHALGDKSETPSPVRVISASDMIEWGLSLIHISEPTRPY